MRPEGEKLIAELEAESAAFKAARDGGTLHVEVKRMEDSQTPLEAICAACFHKGVDFAEESLRDRLTDLCGAPSQSPVAAAAWRLLEQLIRSGPRPEAAKQLRLVRSAENEMKNATEEVTTR